MKTENQIKISGLKIKLEKVVEKYNKSTGKMGGVYSVEILRIKKLINELKNG